MGTNLVNINFKNIANQAKFIDTSKYYQQNLSVLETTMIDQEKQSIKIEREKSVKKETKLNDKFKKCPLEDQEQILNYIASGKGVILYEMITRFDSLDIAPPEEAEFFCHIIFKILQFLEKIMTW